MRGLVYTLPSIDSRFGRLRLLAFLAILAAGLCGYVQAPVLCWPVAAFALVATSWSRHFALVRRGVDAGLDDLVQDTLLRSTANALVATGAVYWFASLVRTASGL